LIVTRVTGVPAGFGSVWRAPRNRRRRQMGAREKLNEFYVVVSVILAAVIGGATESWTAFIVALTLFLVLCLADGDIR
jgi:Flp pilus assembly protein TadB